MRKVVIATANPDKFHEYEEMLKPLKIECLSERDIGFSCSIEETGNSFQENSLLKAETVKKYTDLPVIADDSGLLVDALNGLPGVNSHRFAGENATYEDNTNKLLTLLKPLNLPKYPAHFICNITYLNGAQIINVEGKLSGEIILTPRGNNGFGYDPVFLVKGSNLTLAEMSDEEKNNISHRHNALMKLVEALR